MHHDSHETVESWRSTPLRRSLPLSQEVCISGLEVGELEHIVVTEEAMDQFPGGIKA